ncbi:MAG: hypothetical protein BGO97_10640 [Micrococcales bacterium 70-64]|nr:MAG: hypothetical protein ABT06_10645 [Leifsonia sp. SCN 70-46]OJX86132.1 MAG: hypothetical protein BGO97_10640 [Micrococcales bacterium 70-64]
MRFYRSFNFDYERKWHKSSKEESWEDVTQGWYPFVRVNIDPEVTAVIGANEAGKTQLLNAIESAVTGTNLDPSDFCRYSVFFSVQTDEIRSPEFGATFTTETDEELDLLQSIVPSFETGAQFTLFHPGAAAAFLVTSANPGPVPLEAEQLTALLDSFPRIFKLDTHLAMPDTMSIAELAGRAPNALHSRRKRAGLFNSVASSVWSTAEEFGTNLFPAWRAAVAENLTEAEERRREQFELGRKLLVDVARIDPSSFARLEAAIDGEREGEIEGLVGAMNVAIAENLNFHRWWRQDSNFDIQVKARERELALVIRDRTKASYSFDERSQGLRYFLSYFVQLTAHRASVDRSEIMLLDEPDAFLSSLGQQDLLRVIQDYATPETGAALNQVIYVTHSPFLIDRNAGQRIRVLDKGAEDEGTRIIRDATQNHYEPLRTSLGTTIAETAFIGGKNLFVEGLADQVLIAGVSNHLSRESDKALGLDLNDVTIVASGSASSLPYMVFLARGRGGTLPPCVAVLDGDAEGKRAASELRQKLSKKRRLLDDDFIIEFDEWASAAPIKVESEVAPKEIEDLIPLGLVVDAAREYARAFEGLDDLALSKLTADAIRAALARAKGSMWDALATSYSKAYKGAHIDKVGFAREVLDALSRRPKTDQERLEIEGNFTTLLAFLGEALENAERAENTHRNQNRLARVIAGFERDHPDGVLKKRARALLRELELALDDSDNSDHVRVDLVAMRRTFDLDGNLTGSLPNFAEFTAALRELEVSQRTHGQENAHSTVRARTD